MTGDKYHLPGMLCANLFYEVGSVSCFNLSDSQAEFLRQRLRRLLSAFKLRRKNCPDASVAKHLLKRLRARSFPLR